MSIVGRIYLGVSVMMALMVMIGAFGAWQTGQLANTFVEYRSTAKGTQLSGFIQEDMFEARISSLKYRATRDPAYVDSLSSNIEEVRELEADLTTIAAQYPNAPSVADIIADLGLYEGEMLQAFALQQERQTLVAQSADLGLKARRQLTEIMETALADNDAEASSRAGIAASNLLLGRLYLERYLVDNKEADATRSREEIADARAGMETLLTFLENPRRRELATETITDLDQFAALTTQIADVIAERNAHYAEMDRIGPDVLNRVELIVDSLVERQDTLGPQGQARADSAIYLILGIVALGIFGGSIIALKTVRSVTKNLDYVTDNMTELAEGNLDLEIDPDSKVREIAKMNNAMLVFLENARTAKKLDEEAKTREEEDRKKRQEERERKAELDRQEKERQEKELEAARARAEEFSAFQANMNQVLQKAAKGHLSTRMEAGTNNAELRELAVLINELLTAFEGNMKDVAAGLGKLATGDLSATIDGDREGSFARMQDDFNQALHSLGSAMQQINLGAQSVFSGSTDLELVALDMSKRAEETAASLEETSAAVEQISASGSQVADNASNANEAAKKVRMNALKGRTASDEAEASISALSDASQEIASVVKVIEDIAFQINLLALNAGVEAARAGEAGRGFSVVASEVRQLAQRSQEAVHEISSVIQRNTQTVEEGVEKVSSSRAVLEEIVSGIEVASSQIEDIANAMAQQSVGIQEVSTTVSSLDSASQRNAASLEEMTASCGQLKRDADSFTEALGTFKGVEDYEDTETEADRDAA